MAQTSQSTSAEIKTSDLRIPVQKKISHIIRDLFISQFDIKFKGEQFISQIGWKTLLNTLYIRGGAGISLMKKGTHSVLRMSSKGDVYNIHSALSLLKTTQGEWLSAQLFIPIQLHDGSTIYRDGSNTHYANREDQKKNPLANRTDMVVIVQDPLINTRYEMDMAFTEQMVDLELSIRNFFLHAGPQALFQKLGKITDVTQSIQNAFSQEAIIEVAAGANLVYVNKNQDRNTSEMLKILLMAKDMMWETYYKENGYLTTSSTLNSEQIFQQKALSAQMNSLQVVFQKLEDDLNEVFGWDCTIIYNKKVQLEELVEMVFNNGINKKQLGEKGGADNAE